MCLSSSSCRHASSSLSPYCTLWWERGGSLEVQGGAGGDLQHQLPPPPTPLFSSISLLRVQQWGGGYGGGGCGASCCPRAWHRWPLSSTVTAAPATAVTATTTAAIATPTYFTAMASLRVLAFDHQAATAPPATADSSTRSRWLTRDAAAHLAIRNHLPLAECAHFGQHKTAQALYDAVVARYSSPATAALGRLLLPYLFPELSAFAIVEDLVSHLRASDARYRAAVPAEFLYRNLPPMYITLYFIVTRLPDSLCSVKNHFLSLDPTSLTDDLLEHHLLTAETSAVAVGAARGTPRQPFFEGCSPSPLALSYASDAAADVSFPEDIGAASASAKRRSSKGKGGRGGSGGSSGGGGGSGSGGGGSSGGGEGGGSGGGSGGSGGGSGGSCGSGGSGGGGTGARRVGSGGGQRQQQQHRSETQSPQLLCEWYLRGASGGSCRMSFARVTVLVRLAGGSTLSTAASPASTTLGVLSLVMLLSSLSGQICLSLGASESALSGTAPAKALHTFTLDSGASRCFFRDSTTLTPLSAPVPVRLVDPSEGPSPCPFLHCSPMSGISVRFTDRSSPPLVLYKLGEYRCPPGCDGHYHHSWGSACVNLHVHTDGTSQGHVHSSARVKSVHPRYRAFSGSCVSSGVRVRLGSRLFLVSPPVAPDSSMAPPPESPLPATSSWHALSSSCLWSSQVSASPATLPNPALPPLRGGAAAHRSSLLLISPDDFSPVDSPHGRYAAHQLNLWTRVSLLETLPTLGWMGKVGDASVFWVWGSCAFVRDASADKLSPRAIPCVFLGFVPNAPGWQFYHPTLRRVLLSQDVMFDESVPFYRLFPYRSTPPPPPPLFLALGPPPVAFGSGAAPGAASEGTASGGAEPGGARTWGAEPKKLSLRVLSLGQLCERFVRRARLRSGATGAGGAGAARAGGAGVAGRASGAGGAAATSPGGAGTRRTKAAGTGGVEGAGVVGPGAGGDGAAGTGVGGTGA
ncbi:unnamed protein product [Closterium sp. NIES-54]